LSGRLIAWSIALSTNDWPEYLRLEMLRSMQRQLRMLRRSVEHDIGGNHVIRNSTALVITGLCLGDWRATTVGCRTLEREVPRQVLSDGGHQERSPSYLGEVLEISGPVATTLPRAGTPPPRWGERLHAMTEWLQALA